MEITRVFEILEHAMNKYPKSDALAKKENGEWVKYSTADYLEKVNCLSSGLLQLGLKKGDKIASVSNNCPEWNFFDMAMGQIGVIHVPIYPTISAEEYSYILEHCDAKILLISDKLLFKKLKPIADGIKNIEKIYSFNKVEELSHWTELLDQGKANLEKNEKTIKAIKEQIHPDDVFSIVYTSGTTGVSKGVMLTHDNFVSNLISGHPALPLDQRHKVLSFLPLCHVYERLLTYVFQYKGVGIYYAENMGTIVDNLKEIKADGFDTVPRLLEKVYDTIVTKGKALKGFKKAIFFWSVNLGLRYEYNQANGLIYELKLKLAKKLVFSKWQAALGGNIKFIGCGGAALQPRLTRIFWAAGIPVQEGYGLTETSPLIAINYPHYPEKMIGTVGPVLDGVTVKIDNDGEILVKGPNIMKGYYKNQEMTDEVIDQEGWFHTGDIGTLIDNKYLKITDRKKSIFKLSSGKYVAPQTIENKFKESMFIEQIAVIGENKKFASAIIAPQFDYLRGWCKQHKIECTDRKEIIAREEVTKQYQKIVRQINRSQGAHEQIKRFRLVSDEWSPLTGEFSPTMKLKRKFLEKKYEELIKEIFRDD